MATITTTITNKVLAFNTSFLSEKGNVQSHAFRTCGEANGKTIKVSPALVKGRIFVEGDCLYVSHAVVEGKEESNYQIMRSGTMTFELPSSAPAAPVAPAVADAPVAVEAAPF